MRRKSPENVERATNFRLAFMSDSASFSTTTRLSFPELNVTIKRRPTSGGTAIFQICDPQYS